MHQRVGSCLLSPPANSRLARLLCHRRGRVGRGYRTLPARLPGKPFSWRYQLPFLADRGWHAVAPDLRGYGETDRPTPVAAYRIEHLVDDTAAMSTRSGHDGGCWSGMIGAL